MWHELPAPLPAPFFFVGRCPLTSERAHAFFELFGESMRPACFSLFHEIAQNPPSNYLPITFSPPFFFVLLMEPFYRPTAYLCEILSSPILPSFWNLARHFVVPEALRFGAAHFLSNKFLIDGREELMRLSDHFVSRICPVSHWKPLLFVKC